MTDEWEIDPAAPKAAPAKPAADEWEVDPSAPAAPQFEQRHKDLSALDAGNQARRAASGLPPEPASMTGDDQALGLDTGAVSSARLPGTALSVPLRPSMSQVEFDALNAQASDAATRIEDTLGGAVAGGVAGKLVKGALAARAAAKAAPEVAELAPRVFKYSAGTVAAEKAAAEKIAKEAAEKGGGKLEKLAHLVKHRGTHAIIGGVLGHGHDEEDKITNAAIGAGVGAVLGPPVAKLITSAPAIARAGAALAVKALPAVGAAVGPVAEQSLAKLIGEHATTGKVPLGSAFEAIHNGVPAPLALHMTGEAP